jgi:Zn-dependent oligopeptidase
MYLLPNLVKRDDVRMLFPSSVGELRTRVSKTLIDAQEALRGITTISSQNRTFVNTLQAVDRVAAKVYITLKVAWTLHNVSPDDQLRVAAEEAMVELQNNSVDLIENNIDVYRACKEYAQGAGTHEQLNAEEKNFLKYMLDKFQKQGLGLSTDQLVHVTALKKEIAHLRLEFDANISAAHDTILCTRTELAGCPDDFIESLNMNEHVQIHETTCLHQLEKKAPDILKSAC